MFRTTFFWVAIGTVLPRSPEPPPVVAALVVVAHCVVLALPSPAFRDSVWLLLLSFVSFLAFVRPRDDASTSTK